MDVLVVENFVRLIEQFQSAVEAAVRLPDLALYVDLEQAKLSLLKAAYALRQSNPPAAH